MNTIIRTFFILAISTILVACGGGGGGGSDPAPVTSDGGKAPNPNPNPNPGSDPPPATSSATVTVSWNIPSQRENGDPLQLSEIGSYEIYYFLENTPSSEGEIVSISDPTTTNYTTPALSSGTYYFSIATIDSSGIYSDISDYSTAIIP